MNKHKFTEVFRSLQGEGRYTGANTAWLRLFICNLSCKGFGQDDPTDPSTYKEVGNDIDITNITSFSELPIFKYGCDSAYSVAKKFKHLAYDETAVQIADRIESIITSETNPLGKFVHAHSGQPTHMAFTGGEPLLKFNQVAIIETMHEFSKRNNCPCFVTVETNGTQLLSEEFEDMIFDFRTTSEYGGLVPDALGETEWFWSVSPKIFSTSGEKAKKAIKPEVVSQYAKISNCGQLKYVVNGTMASWKEVEEATALYRAAGVDWPVYIMPVGSLKEHQETMQARTICDEALARGYNVSSRLHCFIYGNELGT